MTERRRPLSDVELARALRELAGALAFPPEPELAARVRASLPQRRQARRPRPFWAPRPAAGWLAGAALLFVALLAGLALLLSPSARNAVADRLGLRGVHITLAPSLTPHPRPSATPAGSPAATALQLGEPVSLAEAEAAAGFRVFVPAALGAPNAVYLDRSVPGGAVTLLYAPRPGLPPAATTGVGLLLSEFRGGIEPDFLGKGVSPGTTLTPLTVGGEAGWWLEGAPHVVFYHAPDGQVRQDRIRLAGNTLLWEHGALTLRLEANLARDAALRIAESAR
ncbi:MAG TPA: hypothetical protein VKV26_02105 [Dehalococcoidia bacterium]|nr:hypothetical protein [Dehalococcoidia bacterium]